MVTGAVIESALEEISARTLSLPLSLLHVTLQLVVVRCVAQFHQPQTRRKSPHHLHQMKEEEGENEEGSCDPAQE